MLDLHYIVAGANVSGTVRMMAFSVALETNLSISTIKIVVFLNAI